jgi:hypothetical protein
MSVLFRDFSHVGCFYDNGLSRNKLSRAANWLKWISPRTENPNANLSWKIFKSPKPVFQLTQQSSTGRRTGLNLPKARQWVSYIAFGKFRPIAPHSWWPSQSKNRFRSFNNFQLKLTFEFPFLGHNSFLERTF